MNRHSVFFKLNLLFALAMAATLVAGWMVRGHLHKRDRTELRLKGRLVIREIRRNRRVAPELLRDLGLRRVADPHLLRQMREKMKRLRRGGAPHRVPRMMLLQCRGESCLMLRTPRGPLFLMPQGSWLARNWLPMALLGGTALFLSLIYWLLRRSLLPLKTLEEEIRRYGRGNEFRSAERFGKGEDEISRLARAFYDSAERVKRLGESRRLFLRTILHELNTPVTKGKLLAEISEDPATKRMLHSIFERLSLLLEELAQVERIAAAGEEPVLRPVRIVDLIDQARDRLYLDEAPPYEGENAVILADFSSLAIVFKNLIDNGLKYGRNLRIRLRGDSLEFVSEGDPLPRDPEWYLKPFRRGEKSAEGFGLGLYIVHEILKRQGMELEYRHEEGKNLFIVRPFHFAA